MMHSLCRLCSSKERIIDVYNSQLESGEELRRYILLASGIEILRDDPISRMVCHGCCEIAVKLHKYRCNAIKNDKTLKEKCGQPYIPPITDKDELLSAASKICNYNEEDVANGEGDSLDALNDYVAAEARALMNSDSIKLNDATNTTNNKIVSQVQTPVTSISTNNSTPRISSTAKKRPSVDGYEASSKTGNKIPKYKAAVPQECVNGFASNSFTNPNNRSSTPQAKPTSSTNDRIVNGNSTHNESLPSVLKRDITNSIITHSALSTFGSDSQDNSSSTSQKIGFHDPVAKHPTVEELLKEYNSLQLPEEVYSSNISPKVALNPTEVNDWYALQLQQLKDKLKEISDSTNIIPNENYLRPRLRTRVRTRVMSTSSEDDDEEWLPNKSSSDSDGSKRTKSNSSVTKTSIIPTTVHNLPLVNQTYATNVAGSYALTTTHSNSATLQTTTNGLQVLIGYAIPTPVVHNTINTVNFTDSNSSVLKTLLQSSSCQTTANLLTDFSKYGINVESSEPPISFEESNDPLATDLITDITLDAITENQPQDIITSPNNQKSIDLLPDVTIGTLTEKLTEEIATVNNNKPAEEDTLTNNKKSEDVICISDDEDVVDKEVPKQSTDTNIFTDLNEQKTIESLLKKFISSKQLDKDVQTFNPIDSAVHRTKTNLIALPNMLEELRRYKVPIELEYSPVNNARFVENVKPANTSTTNFWISEDCIDIEELPINTNYGTLISGTVKNLNVTNSVAQEVAKCSPIQILRRLNEIDSKKSLNTSTVQTHKQNLSSLQTTLHSPAVIISNQNTKTTIANFIPSPSISNTPKVVTSKPVGLPSLLFLTKTTATKTAITQSSSKISRSPVPIAPKVVATVETVNINHMKPTQIITPSSSFVSPSITPAKTILAPKSDHSLVVRDSDKTVSKIRVKSISELTKPI